MTYPAKKEGRIRVRAHYRTAGETDREATGERKIDVGTFEGPTGSACVGFSRKVYQGQYNSAEVSVWVTLPCYPEEVEEALDEANRIAHSRISKLLKRLGA